jgi:hypothetical protein
MQHKCAPQILSAFIWGGVGGGHTSVNRWNKSCMIITIIKGKKAETVIDASGLYVLYFIAVVSC